MVFRGGELEYDNFELLRGQSHVIKVTQRSKKVHPISGFDKHLSKVICANFGDFLQK